MSYYTPTLPEDNDPEPEETHLKVGQHRQVGSVRASRARVDLYVAVCGVCGWHREYHTTSPNVMNWEVFCHNRTRIKQGCPPIPTMEERQ